MILYRKAASLRIKRFAVPEPPYWCATAVAPYSARRAAPVAIDYLDLRATAASERLEVAVCDRVRDELERAAERLREPVLIEATEIAEAVFGRGEQALDVCSEQGLAALHLVSTRGTLPERTPEGSAVAVSAWPLEMHRLEPLFETARERQLRWGVAVPVIYPVTTNTGAIEELAEAARKAGAAFLAPVAVALDATAKDAIARALSLDEETYTQLFHAELEPVHVAAERRIGAVAHAAGLADFILPPRWERKSNWNAAVLLSLTASRMIAMEQDLDVAISITRSARIVAELEKPIERVAEAASLAIIEGVDETSREILTAWLAGEESIADEVFEQWRD